MNKLNPKETKDIYIRVPKDMKDRLLAAKKKTGFSINTIILNCIERQLQEERK